MLTTNENKFAILTSLPYEILLYITFQCLNSKDVVNLLQTCKLLNRHYGLQNYQRNAKNPKITLLEAVIENEILKIFSSTHSIYLCIDANEDPHNYFFKNLDFMQKIQILQVDKKITKFVKESCDKLGRIKPEFLETQPDAKKFIEDFMGLLIKGAGAPPEINSVPKMGILSSLENINERNNDHNPLLVSLAHRIGCIHTGYKLNYFYPTFFCFRGKDLMTLQKLNHAYIRFSNLRTVEMNNQLLKITKSFFMNQYNLQEVSIDSNEFIQLTNLFVTTPSPFIFHEMFPILYSKSNKSLTNLFSINIKNLNKLFNYKQPLTWISNYTSEQITIFLSKPEIFFCMVKLLDKYHRVFSKNVYLFNQLKDMLYITSSFNSNNPNITEKNFVEIGEVLNYFFNRYGIEDIISFMGFRQVLNELLGIDSQEILHQATKFTLDQLKLMPTDVMSSVYKEINVLNQPNINFYETLYFEFWPHCIGSSSIVSTKLKDYMIKHQINLCDWCYDDLLDLNADIVESLPAEYFKVLTPEEIVEEIAIIEYHQREPDDIDLLIVDFIRNAHNVVYYGNLLGGLCEIENKSECLRQLAATKIDERSLLDLLKVNDNFIKTIFEKGLLFEVDGNTRQGQLRIKDEFKNIITSGIYDFIKSSAQMTNSWLEFIFTDNSMAKIEQLSAILPILKSASHCYLNSVKPLTLLTLANIEIFNSTLLYRLATARDFESFIGMFDNISSNNQLTQISTTNNTNSSLHAYSFLNNETRRATNMPSLDNHSSSPTTFTFCQPEISPFRRPAT